MKRKKIFTWVSLGIIGVIIGMQLWRPKKNQQNTVSENDITTKIETSADVKQILAVACNDCHSNNTRYPWYAEVMPVGWWINHHVEEGKQHLNFSEAGVYSYKKLNHKLEELEEEVEKGRMPPDNYTSIHKDAILTDAQKQLLIDWAREGRKQLESQPEE